MESENQLEGVIKEIYEAHQRLRQDPKSFIPVLENIMQHFGKDGKLLSLPGATPVMHHEGTSAYKEAISFLKKENPVDIEFYFSDLLSKSAADHANDIGPKGKTGHVGSDKSTYGQRIERYCKWGGAIFESIDYSRPEVTGETIVAKLIVDDGIKSRNHRKVIFQPCYKHIGIAECEHSEFGRVVVIDYGAQILSHKDYEEMQNAPIIEEEVKKNTIDTSQINWAELSRKIGEEINKVRKNPKHLIKQMERSLGLFKKYKILSVPGRETREFKEGAPAYIEAIEFWDKQRPVREIKISQNLKKAAKDHVADLGETGHLTQIGSNGSSPKDRMERYTGIDALWSESLMFGGYKPREIVEYMLIADGDKSRGLRKNIFNPKLKLMGVAAGPHPESGSVIVVDFVAKEIGIGELPTIHVENTEVIPEEVKKQLEDMGVSKKVKIVHAKGKTVTSMKEKETVTSNGKTETKTKMRPYTAKPLKGKAVGLDKGPRKPKLTEKKPEIPKFGGRRKANTVHKPTNSTNPRAVKTPQISKLKKNLSHKEPVSTSTPSKRFGVGSKRPVTSRPTPPKPIKDETKYEEIAERVNPEELEVLSDFSYEKETDPDLPEGLKSVTWTTEIRVQGERREMLIRKRYFLEDGRELRTKSILPIKEKS